MRGRESSQSPVVRRQWPYVIVATGSVILLPPAAVSLLPLSRGLTSLLVSGVACLVVSLLVARLASSLWRRFPQSQDLLFADLLLWGWVRRLRTERRLRQARNLVDRGARDPASVDAVQRLRALEQVSALVESRDAYTHRHSLRVTRHAEGIARQLGLPDAEVTRIRTAAALHDVGKICTPRSVLNKPGKLSDAEFDIVKRHPGQGAELLEGVVEPAIVSMVRHHHERLGGTGYPDRLAGDAISRGARIIAVADTFDAMTSTRAYRAARPHERALAVLREESGVGLDAAAVGAFVAYYSGRRGLLWSTVATAASSALLPLRGLLGPVGLARTLPALGASVAIAAPLLASGASLADRFPGSPIGKGHAGSAGLIRAPGTGLASAPAFPAPTPAGRALPAVRRDHAGGDRATARRRPGRPVRKPGRPADSGTGVPTTSHAGGGGGSPPRRSPAPAATSAPAPAPATAPASPVPPPVSVGGDGVTVTTPPLVVKLPPVALPVPTIEVPPITLHVP